MLRLQCALARALTLPLTPARCGRWRYSPSPSTSTSPNLNHRPPSDSDQVARLQRELHRERWIMEREQAVAALESAKLASGSESGSAGAPGSGQRRRRSTNIGHRFGSGRGPMVLKTTLHHGDVNTRVSVLRKASRQRVAPDPTRVPLPAQVTRSIGDWDAARPRTLHFPTPIPSCEPWPRPLP